MDTGEFLSSVSPRYTVTTHTEVNAFTERLLTSQSLPYEIGRTAVASKGNKFFREIRFPSMKFTPDGSDNTALDGGKTDDIYPTIILRNSYDRSSSIDFLYGGFRLICTNGMIIGDIAQRISQNHMKPANYDRIGDILVSKLEETIVGFKQLYKTLNTTPATSYVDVLLMEVFSKKMAETATAMSAGLIVPEYDDSAIIGFKVSPQLSAYALYNICTAVASHKIKKYSRSLLLQKQIAKVFAE
jgi:hypothetical protein